MAEAKTHQGGCHCKRVRYEVTGDFSVAMECNCSYCSIKGLLIAPAQPDNFKLLQGEENLAEYQFYKHRIHHSFCKTCGTQAFARGIGRNGEPMMAINVRSLDGIDLATLERKPFDGRAM